MDHYRIAGAEFHAFDIVRGRDGNGRDQIAINILALRRQIVGLRDGHDKIRLAQPPTLGEMRRGREIGRTALGAPLIDPAFDQGDLLVVKAAFADKFAAAFFREPGRHVPALGDLRDQL